MGSRLVWIISALALSVITMIVCTAVNATIAHNPYSGALGRNTGEILLIPMPAISTAWTIFDLEIYKLRAHYCVYWLVQRVLLCAAYVTMRIMVIMPYSWGDDASWIKGMLHLIMAVFSHRFRRRHQQATKVTRAKDVDLSDNQAQTQQPNKTTTT